MIFGEKWSNKPVPITGLTQDINTIVFLLIAILGSIITVIVFPKIFCPLFLKLKRLTKRRYKDAFVQTNPAILSKRKLLIRCIYIFLLELGLLAVLIPLTDPKSWLPGGTEAVAYYESLGVPPQYVMTILITFVCILLPIVNGIWSIGWALQDQGLIHYKFDDRPGRDMFEIEPIYLSFNSYLKGYAGISSIVFLIQVALAWASVTVEPRTEDIIFTFVLPLSGILMSLPAYFFYAKFTGSKVFLRKSLMEMKRLSEAEVIKMK